MRELQNSLKWLSDQLDRKKKSLDAYCEKDGHNKQYANSERAFIAAVTKHINTVNHILTQFEINEKKNKQEIEMLSSLLRMHGVTNVMPMYVRDFRFWERELKANNICLIPEQLKKTIYPHE